MHIGPTLYPLRLRATQCTMNLVKKAPTNSATDTGTEAYIQTQSVIVIITSETTDRRSLYLRQQTMT